MKRKLLIIFLSIVTICCLAFGISACSSNESKDSTNNSASDSSTNNESKTSSEKLKYTISDDGTYYIVSGIGEYTGTDLVIPSTYEGLPVTAIGDYAFKNCTSLINVTIGENIESMGEGSFYNCTALTGITFNATAMSNLTENNYVFYCAGQSGEGITVTIGANVRGIPEYLFFPYSENTYSPKLTSVVFEDDSVCSSIGSFAFRFCTTLKSVTV